jgi:hypothetical protein
MDFERPFKPDGGTSSSRSLPAAAHAALRAALGAQLRRSPLDEPDSTLRLRRALRLLCDDARARGVRVEQLVVTIKRAWHSLPEAAWRPGDDRGTGLLRQVVSVCIEEYYAERRAGDLPAAGSGESSIAAGADLR